jgi:uncharacterized protein
MEKATPETVGPGAGVHDEGLLERLLAEHRALDSRLNEIESHISLTAEEQVERSRIKKLKLATKDRIAALKRQQQKQSSS